MALVTVRKSDYSGQEIPEGEGARVRIEYDNHERTTRRADLTAAEVEKLLPFAQEVQIRPAARKVTL